MRATLFFKIPPATGFSSLLTICFNRLTGATLFLKPKIKQMEKALRRRQPTARQKEGIYRDSGSEPNRENRQKRRSRNKRLQTGASARPGYQDIERSMRDRRNRRGYEVPEWLRDEPVRQARPNERYRSINADRFPYKGLPDPLHPFNVKTRGGRRRKQGLENKFHGERVRYRDVWPEREEQGHALYGEHPDSRGYEEYLGSHKRHPGLLGREDHFFDDKNEGKYYRGQDEWQPRSETRKRQTLQDYLNRHQYAVPYHPLPIYDPLEAEYEQELIDRYDDDHRYWHSGYQHMGNTEGFGIREGRQQGHSWIDEDEYREGHAPRQRGYGKYGSR